MRWIIFVLTSLPLWAQIQGTVVNANTHATIEGAIVKIQMQSESATTDANGFFELNDTADFPFVLTAAAYNYFNGFVTITEPADLNNILIEIEPIAQEAIPNYPLNEPEICEACHQDQVDEWAVSPMANTGLNTWVFDVYNGEGTPGGMNGFVYQRDSVHRFAKPNSDCSACHSPVHWLTDIQNAGMGDINNPTTNMELGVQCEVCHRAHDVDENRLNFPGVMPESFSFFRGPQNLEFGLLGDVTYEEFIMRGAYNPNLSAKLCAACHEDNVDHDDDNDYEDAGSVPHETTFSEWQNYRGIVGPENAQSCIECHMPLTSATRFCIFVPNRPAFTARNHDIRGTTPDFLENAVTLHVATQVNLGQMEVIVDIENNLTGHAVPTGVVIRNMILLVDVLDESQNRLAQMTGGMIDDIGGIGDPADGYYAGLPGQAFYKNMTDGVEDGIFYTEATGYAFDNRIQPGDFYQDTLRFSLGGTAPDNVTLDVRLIYRRSFRYLLDQKGWTLTGHGNPLADIQPPHYGHLMERYEDLVDVCGFKDLNGSTTVDMADLLLLNPLWRNAAPFGVSEEPITNVKHFISMANCL